ncbi:MAG: 5-deoxy-glucuronate isomerase [Chloroflexota bacterium]|nr:5-deoxy-glucuronate isomerase [Chloroflexota bacterium]
MTHRLHRRAGPPHPQTGQVHGISADDAGWKYVGFADYRLAPGQSLTRPADGHELAVIVLEGSASIRADGKRYSSLGSRETVFDGPPPPVLLLEPGSDLEVEAESAATIIVADAPAADVRLTRLFEPADLYVETRGAGITERRIHHLLPPTTEAGRLILFEVYTPGGNWSSYPPHKHDTEDPPREAYLEELYYYRFKRPEGWGFARVYTPDGALDESFAPTDSDVLLIPRGYHPFGAPAGYDAYYLNVMAGPNRAWHFTLDPDHAWLMNWDPQLPA